MHSNGSSETLFKYCSRSDFGYEGFTDTLTILTSDDDVAHYKWGGNWRMPTVAEFEELLFNCDCEWITQNGVKGLKVTSRKDSSQSIFLPATGFRDGTGLNALTTMVTTGLVRLTRASRFRGNSFVSLQEVIIRASKAAVVG